MSEKQRKDSSSGASTKDQTSNTSPLSLTTHELANDLQSPVSGLKTPEEVSKDSIVFSPRTGKPTIRDLLSAGSSQPPTEGRIDPDVFTSPTAASDLAVSATASDTLLTDRAAAATLPLLQQLTSKNHQAQILAEKAALLLGLARKFESSSRGKALQSDAEKFLRFAGEIQESEEGSDVVHRAQAFADVVMDKYESHGKGVFAESQRMWDELMGSTEAAEIMSAGQVVLQDWLTFGDSPEGRKLVETLQNTIFSSVGGSGDGLIELAMTYTADADAWLDSMDRNKDALQRGVEQATKAVEEDAELAGWLQQGKDLLRKGAKKTKKAQKEALARRAKNRIHGSWREGLAEQEQKAKQERMSNRRLAVIAKRKAFRSIRKSEKSNEQTSTKKLHDSASDSFSDVDASFFDSDSEDDEALVDSDFNSDYYKEDEEELTTDDEGLEINAEETLSSLSSSAQHALAEIQSSEAGKKALKKGAEVLKSLHETGDLSPDTVIENVKKLQDDPNARQALVTKIKDAALEFLLAYLPEVKIAPLKEDGPKSMYTLENIDLSGFKLKSQDVDVILTDHGVSVTAKHVSCRMKDLKWTYKSKKFPYVGSHGDANATALEISIRLILEVQRTRRDDASDTDQANQPKVKVEVLASPMTSTSTSTSTTSDTPSSTEVDSSPHGVSLETESSSRILNTIDDVLKYDYALVLVRERRRKIVEMPHLEIEITNCWLSSVINIVLSLLQESVRGYVEKELNDAVLKHSGRLLTTVNEYAKEYLPLFASVKDKVVEKAPKLVNIASNTFSEIQQNVKEEMDAKNTNKLATSGDHEEMISNSTTK